jgi:NAD(P)-dependent dehydrogenase (short-subunit alcohol dehydrogenase family)
MNLELKDKAVLITGGASGIGAACAHLFVAEGARVAIVDRDRERGEALAAELGRAGTSVVFLGAALTDEAACREAVAGVNRAFGRVDILVNNAGINDGVALEQRPAEFLDSLQRNLFHVFAVTHFARESLIASSGSIVNVGSKVAVTGQGRTSGYAAAKGGVLALTREWAVALAPHGVRVNCVVPAECDTPLYRRWFDSQPDPATTRAAVERLVPLGNRLTTPEEVAATIVFLGSPCASHTTGQIVFVDGGYTHLDRAASHSHTVWDGHVAAPAAVPAK